jgi:hypothetical protein
MKRTSEPTTASGLNSGGWVVNYDVARAQAIRWLGDRYLLAKPINRPFQGRADSAASRATWLDRRPWRS